MAIQNVNGIRHSQTVPGQHVTDAPVIPVQKTQEVLPQEKKAQAKQDVASKQGAEVKNDVLEKAIEEANEVFQHVRPDIKFVLDSDTKEVILMMVEPNTGDVIRRYPTEQALAITDAISKSQLKLTGQPAFRQAGDGILGLFVEHKT